MKNYLISSHFDLITEDGYIVDVKKENSNSVIATVKIENISEAFLGFQTDEKNIFFNLKSTLAQIGVDTKKRNLSLNLKKREAEV
ncbi:MAG: hypothetical protein KR126chlam6_01324, partial [Candidatus Anoxychlamydiales bacterium]|nr:hypothetical protein [Candidatus Anoxychlamydiales bacterium]